MLPRTTSFCKVAQTAALLIKSRLEAQGYVLFMEEQTPTVSRYILTNRGFPSFLIETTHKVLPEDKNTIIYIFLYRDGAFEIEDQALAQQNFFERLSLRVDATSTPESVVNDLLSSITGACVRNLRSRLSSLEQAFNILTVSSGWVPRPCQVDDENSM